jgi:hypothetical protein
LVLNSTPPEIPPAKKSKRLLQLLVTFDDMTHRRFHPDNLACETPACFCSLIVRPAAEAGVNSRISTANFAVWQAACGKSRTD